MTRKPRLTAPHCFFHVMARGNNRQDVFADSDDYRSYLAHLKSLLGPLALKLHAYCLMPNHVHLLLETLSCNLSDLMMRQHGWYARRWNWKRGGVGHVFQGRFVAKLVADDSYLQAVARYIHMNPVKARLVQSPERYPWSSFNSYMVKADDGLVSRERLLALHESKARLHEFTAAEDAGTEADPSWYDELPPPESPDERFASGTEAILRRVCETYGVSLAALRRPRTTDQVAEARAAALLGLRGATDLSLAEIAQELALSNPNYVANRISWLRRKAAASDGVRSRLIRCGMGEALSVIECEKCDAGTSAAGGR